MTRGIHILLLALVTTLMANAALASGPEYRIAVKGLSCPFCAYGIEKQLNRVEGVEALETNIEAGTVTITMTEGQKLTESRAEEAVDKAGFSLGGFERIEAGENP